MASEDKAALLNYAFSEVESFLLDIPNAASYKEKDLIFVCEDLILGLIMHLCPTSAEIPQDAFAKIQLLVETVEKQRYIETALDNLFKQELIEEAAVSHLLSLVAQTDDEYQKGMLYTGLVHYKEEISKFSDDAKALIAAHLTAELKRYLNHEQFTADCIKGTIISITMLQIHCSPLDKMFPLRLSSLWPRIWNMQILPMVCS